MAKRPTESDSPRPKAGARAPRKAGRPTSAKGSARPRKAAPRPEPERQPIRTAEFDVPAREAENRAARSVK